ncbi:spore germination protein [Candidatus Clostridium stratigraminis]|uniref:Spore germination protein n=1 Tax=Candidatus Clostridium stratigraminis TaxID=3381661 RepID=A0ABW8T5V4_9CLOT
MTLINTNIEDVINILKNKFEDCPDIILRQVFLNNGMKGYFIFISGLIDLDLFQRDFFKYLMSLTYDNLKSEKFIKSIPIAKLSIIYYTNSILSDVTQGKAVFIAQGLNFAISSDLAKFEKREISEPESEKNVRGSHEGFVECANTNISILRRKIRNNDLKFKLLRLGTSTNQDVYISYINKIANPEILKELEDRISKVNYDGLLGSGYLEQMISDSPNSPFPQFVATERPDKIVSMLLEGRYAVIVDGTPVVIAAPVSFFSFFQSQDDFNGHWILGTFLGIIRLIALLVALLLPAIYIAVTYFHYYMVPLKLLIPLAESRGKVPFPPYLEAVIMETTIELLREASVRLPTYIGTSIGIIGGIVIGQAAVQAGIVSVLMIIVVSITAIASYVTPLNDMGFAIRFYRFMVMLVSAVFGAVGILVCIIFLMAHLISLETLGQPYFQPIAPLVPMDFKNVFIRAPFKFLKKRPSIAKPLNEKRGFDDDK